MTHPRRLRNRSSEQRSGLSRLFGLLIAAVLLCGSNAALPATMEVVVVGVTDGDTLVVLEGGKFQHKVRVAGIDAPEKRQAFGRKAQNALASAVHQRKVVLDWHKKDRYGRVVAKVLIADRDIGLELVAAGWAWHYKDYQHEQMPKDRRTYASAEVAARQRRLGLWADATPIAPWDFRQAK